jgi:hypothetical protein
MNKLLNEELYKMKYLFGYELGKVISEQETPSVATPTAVDVIKQIQTTLNTKYGNKLVVDGKWGNLTQTAFESAVKSKSQTQQPQVQTQQPQVQTQQPQVQTQQPQVQTQQPQVQTQQPQVQTQQNQTTSTGESGGEIYARLNADGVLGFNRGIPRITSDAIRYKGPDLSKEEIGKLTTFLQGRGFRLSRFNNDYKDGDKLIYKRNETPKK